jgi:hypothetical protein
VGPRYTAIWSSSCRASSSVEVSLNPRNLICALSLVLIPASTTHALPLYEYIGIDFPGSPGMKKCAPQCSVPDWSMLTSGSIVETPYLVLSTDPSVASLHAEVPTPWYNAAKGIYHSAASIHADIPPPWSNVAIGGVVVLPQSSNNIGGDVGKNSWGEITALVNQQAPVSYVQTTNIPTGWFENDVTLDASIVDPFGITEPLTGEFASTSQCSGSSNQPCVQGSFAPSVSPSPAQVPEPTSIGLIFVGLMFRFAFARK